jgi:hypothetical protein
MDGPRGMLEIEDLKQKIEIDQIDTVVVAFTDHYGRVLGKRFDARHFIDEGLEHGTHGCDYLLTVDMETEPVPGYEYANWELGYGDFHMVPDLTTLRLATRLDRSAFVLCDLRDPHSEELVSVAPRTILHRQLEKTAESGYVDTEEKMQRRLVHIPMERFGEAAEIPKAALYLASDESSYVTGTGFVVDGGVTAAYVTPE